MKSIWTANGHLREEALLALLHNEPMDELNRLEIAEHLSFCDLCLQRYTELLADRELSAPANSCRETFWQQVRLRALRFFTYRYAAAAAAVALALTLLWGSGHPAFFKSREDTSSPSVSYTEALQKRWDGTIDHTSTWLSALMDRIDPFQEGKD